MQKKYGIMLTIITAVVIFAAVAVIVFMSNRGKEPQDGQPANSNVVEEEKDKKEEKEEVKKEEEKETEEPEKEEEVSAVPMKTTSNVNLRKEPNTDCEILVLIPQGSDVEKFSEENGWAKVKYDGKIGYVSAEYLIDPSEVKEETSSTTPKVEAIPGQHRNPNSAVVVIDPGHQLHGDSTKEPNGPGASVMKARVTSGTRGVATGVAEYILNLDISLKLKTELENRGYTVYMTRSVHEINISNMERAKYASSVGADIAVRIHANGSSNAGVRGVETYVPSASNPYVSHLASASYSLGKCIVDAYASATGFNNRGVFANDTMTGMNWSEVPVAILEMGYMSNAEDDRAMQDPTMQNNMVQGIANGIDAYFGF